VHSPQLAICSLPSNRILGSMVDRLHLMAVFVAVAEEEGFAGGARHLGLSPPTVTRAIAALEAHLGVVLFTRTTRYVRLTDAGQRYLEDARRVLQLADEADQAALGVNGEPRGSLVVTASVLFGRLFVMSGIIEYMHRYPAVEVSAIFIDRVINLMEEGIDVAIRIGELPDSSYRAMHVGSVRRLLCASPDYLARHGIPESPDELCNHQIVLSSGLNASAEIRFFGDSRAFNVKSKPRLMVNDIASLVEAAVSGLGIAQFISYQIGAELEAGSLQVVLDEYELSPVPVSIVHNEGRVAPAKIRTFIDLMAERLRATNLIG
jgi:DNA-binding transcriptional LysR family regulator